LTNIDIKPRTAVQALQPVTIILAVLRQEGMCLSFPQGLRAGAIEFESILVSPGITASPAVINVIVVAEKDELIGGMCARFVAGSTRALDIWLCV
jgi:hypothetical protein